MAKTTKTTAKKTTSKKTPDDQPMIPAVAATSTATSLPVSKITSRNLIILLILAGVILIWLYFRSNPGLFLAATVNGKPILKSQLQQRLVDRFGEQMLEAMISERLIENEAEKRGVTVTNEELQTKIKDIENKLQGSMSLDKSLQIQGITRGEFERQIRIQMMIDKMFAAAASVSAEQIDQYIKDQGATMIATEPAAQRVEAEQQLRNNQISQVFIDWFNTAKAEASISKYLNRN